MDKKNILDLKKSKTNADTTSLECESEVRAYKLYGQTYEKVKLADPGFCVGERGRRRIPIKIK